MAFEADIMLLTPLTQCQHRNKAVEVPEPVGGSPQEATMFGSTGYSLLAKTVPLSDAYPVSTTLIRHPGTAVFTSCGAR